MAPKKKRKKSTAPRPSKARKGNPPATVEESPVQEEEGEHKTGFLDLAPELRDLIYDCVLEICPTTFSKKAKHLTSTSGLARVNKQIRSEFLARAVTNAPVLKTTVNNFDFSHVVTFLNKLPDSDISDLEAAEPQRTMLIDLNFKGPYPADLKLLERWLGRIDATQYVPVSEQIEGQPSYKPKKGAYIDFEYSAKPAHPAFYLPPVTYVGFYPREISLTRALRTGYKALDQGAKIRMVLRQGHVEFEKAGLRDELDEEDQEVLRESEKEQDGRQMRVWPWHLRKKELRRELR